MSLTVSESASEHARIPRARFLENIDAAIREQLGSELDSAGDTKVMAAWEAMFSRLEELYSKYKFMEQNLRGRRSHLLAQLPELRTNLEVLEQLRSQPPPLRTSFLLSEQVHARARIDSAEEVLLWLGAKTMLELPIADAVKLLDEQRVGVERELENLDAELAFLREQTTTAEVNRARLHNWRVERTRTHRAAVQPHEPPHSHH